MKKLLLVFMMAVTVLSHADTKRPNREKPEVNKEEVNVDAKKAEAKEERGIEKPDTPELPEGKGKRRG